ncbi:MAG: hypothetical protein GX621_04900, partial [Pirellulaceae bacterium]|nr:hypothetical protein [Pirellulaceae bacterium]
THGEWLPWLESNFDGTPRLAQQYMRVADRWPEITANTKHVSHLSFREALRLTAEPSPQRDEPRDWFTGVDEDFVAIIPEPSPDRMLYALDEHDRSYLVEVHPSREHVGYYHLLVYRGLDTEVPDHVGDDEELTDCYVDFNSRPCKYTTRMLAYILDRWHGIKPTIWDLEPAEETPPWPIESGVERMERVCREARERGEEDNEESTEAKELRELQARIEANMPIVRPLLDMLDRFDKMKPGDELTAKEADYHICYLTDDFRAVPEGGER